MRQEFCRSCKNFSATLPGLRERDNDVHQQRLQHKVVAHLCVCACLAVKHNRAHPVETSSSNISAATHRRTRRMSTPPPKLGKILYPLDPVVTVVCASTVQSCVDAARSCPQQPPAGSSRPAGGSRRLPVSIPAPTPTQPPFVVWLTSVRRTTCSSVLTSGG